MALVRRERQRRQGGLPLGLESPRTSTRDLTYADLKDEVSKAANALVELGVETGDRVAIYMPMIPETVIMLARARVGARSTVRVRGFSSTSWPNRLADCDAGWRSCRIGGYRRGAPSVLKPAVDEVIEKASKNDHEVLKVLVWLNEWGEDVEWNDDRDVWLHDVADFVLSTTSATSST